LTTCTGLPISTGVSGLGTGVATALAVNTGSAGSVLVNGGVLGTPSSGILTSATGYTTANLVGTISNAQLANSTISGVSLGSNLANLTAGTNINFSVGTTYNGSSAITISATGAAQVYPGAGIANSTGTAWGTSYTTTGTGTVVALATSPTLVTPTIGVASATSVNKVAITAPATSATLTLADGSTLATSGAFSQTLTATATTAVTLPTSGYLIGSVTQLGANPVTGTPSNTTYLRGDGTWATVSGGGGSPGGSNTQVQYNSSGSFAGSANFVFDGTNVGIGTTSPSYPLDVQNGSIRIYNSTYPALRVQNSSTGTGATDGLLIEMGGTDVTFDNYESGNIVFKTADTERIRITSAGNVGIGTSSPTGSLSVASTSVVANPTAWGAGYSVFGPNAGSASGAALGLSYYTASDQAQITALAPGVAWKPLVLASGGLIFQTSNGSDAGRFDSSGNLLVGTTSASNSPFSSTSKFVVSGSFTGGFGQSITDTNTNTAVDHYLMSFNLGTSSGNQKGYIQFVGSSGLILYSTTSDQRFKTDLGVVTETSVIDNLLIHDYTWKESGVAGRGVFAQEAYEIMPNAIAKGKDAEDGSINMPWGVDYSKFVPDLIVHAQQLKKQVQELNTLITAQSATITSLTARITALENK